ncbi:hypothetical protein NIES2098_14900 [Calothrix sp. NIES-2098]|nr:hypothetical protein NIES2098_14900 [Calothrix sp. NIES-2098]
MGTEVGVTKQNVKKMELSQTTRVGLAPLLFLIQLMLSLSKEVAEVLSAFQVLFVQQIWLAEGAKFQLIY